MTYDKACVMQELEAWDKSVGKGSLVSHRWSVSTAMLLATSLLSGCNETWSMLPLTVDGHTVLEGAFVKDTVYCAKVENLVALVGGKVTVEDKGLGMTLTFPQTTVVVGTKKPADPSVKHIDTGVRFLNTAPVLCNAFLDQALRFAYPDATVKLTPNEVLVSTQL